MIRLLHVAAGDRPRAYGLRQGFEGQLFVNLVEYRALSEMGCVCLLPAPEEFVNREEVYRLHSGLVARKKGPVAFSRLGRHQ